MLTGDILRHSAARHPRKIALICGAERLSYGALDRAANRIANMVRGLGLRKGARVALLCRNRPDYVALHFGLARAGVITVHISPAYGAGETAHILAKTRPALAFTETELADKVAGVPRVILVDGKGRDGLARLTARASDGAPQVALSGDDPFAMTFTGGTMGFPKGAVVSYAARRAAATTTALEHGLTSRDVVALPLPLYHAAGLLIWGQAAMLVGATSVLMARWDPDEFIALAHREGISNAILVPVQMNDLLARPAFNPDGVPSLHTLASGGSPKHAGLFEAVVERLPHATYIDHYGQSEVGPATILKSWHPREKARSIGLPAIGLELKVVDTDGAPVKPGVIGEILIKGPCLMAGYYKDPAETARYFRTRDGWGWSGDLAIVDEDGFITLAGRAKDMIITGGINVYPREVEIVLEAHPAVAECVAFGVPDERWGEAMVAYVVRANGAAIAAEALIEHCGASLARYKRPKIVRFVDAIPKTATGKVLKQKLREDFLSNAHPVRPE